MARDNHDSHGNWSRGRDLAIVSAAALAALVIAAAGYSTGILGLVVGLVLSLLLPGYAATAAILNRQLELLERVMLAISLSIAIAIFVGLLINLLPAGLQVGTWAVSLSLLTIACCAIAYIRRSPGGDRITHSFAMPRPRLRDVLLLSAAIAITLLSANLAVHSAQIRRDPGFTQLWMLPSGNNPTGEIIQVGVASKETQSWGYTLDIHTSSGLKLTYQLNLAPGDVWEKEISVKPGSVLSVVSVEADLYRSDSSAKVYRHVSVVLDPFAATSTPSDASSQP